MKDTPFYLPNTSDPISKRNYINVTKYTISL